jgi:hypothetical protein
MRAAPTDPATSAAATAAADDDDGGDDAADDDGDDAAADDDDTLAEWAKSTEGETACTAIPGFSGGGGALKPTATARGGTTCVVEGKATRRDEVAVIAELAAARVAAAVLVFRARQLRRRPAPGLWA